jgi:hypothetical protein
MSGIPFTCGCGAKYPTPAAWEALPLVGYLCQPEDNTGPEEHLELRNCPCGSTKAVEVVHPNCKEIVHV